MAKAKFSLAFFKTKTGHTTLWVVGGLVLFYIVYRYISGIGGGTVINTANSGPSDAQIQAEAAGNLATINANAGVSATQIQTDAANIQAGLAAQVALAQINEQGAEAALGATVANNTITAQVQGLVDSNKTSLAQSTIASNTILAQGKQQNDLLIAQMNTQAATFNHQVDANLAGQELTFLSTISKKKSSAYVKQTAPIFAASISGFLNNAGGGASNVTLH